jgi:mono/diheme cytochrome c family protein
MIIIKFTNGGNMKKYIVPIVGLALLSILVLSACSSAAKTEAPAAEEADVAVPDEYAGLKNPMDGNAAAIESGKAVYVANCQSCHGEKGLGDGPAGASLSPKPGDLVEVAANDTVDRIYWRVSEGGMMAPFNSSMPAWKGVLSEDERWQVVSFVKTLK